MDPPGVPDPAPHGQAPPATPLRNPSDMHAPMPGVAWMSAACLTCGYSLARLPAAPCPECGRMFDPADANTVGPRGSSRVWLWVSAAAWLCTPGPVYGAAGVGALYLIAWAVLARPPQPWVHDPKSIPGVASLHTLVLLALIFSPLLTALAIVLACIGAAARDRWKLLVAPVLLCLLAWPVALLTMWLYPARLWAWWVD